MKTTMTGSFSLAKTDSIHTHTRTQAIIVLELILYMLFGLVQLFQGFFPSGNRKIEAAYIILSLVAKFLLGVMLFANVMFT
jgi:hypothetical protein